MPSITKFDPDHWEDANVVQLDVDAASNADAINAIEDWAYEHGFARVRENFLRVILRADGSRVFRGACYRLTEEEKAAIQYETGAIADRAARLAKQSPAMKTGT